FACVDAPAAEFCDDLIVRAARKAVEQDGAPAEADAQRRRAIVVSGATAHPATPPPCSAKAVDDLPRAALETLRLMALGHGISSLHASPAPPPLRAGANAFSYNRCSLYVLSRFDQVRNREMFPWIAFIAGWLVLAAPVHAQTATESSSPSPEERNGYRLAETADGFQLVEHGVWKAPQVNPAPASAPGPGAFGSQGAGPRHEGQARLQAGPNGFRRVAYLPHVYAAEAQFGLPTGLLDALIWTESRYNPFAVSKAGAAGL